MSDRLLVLVRGGLIQAVYSTDSNDQVAVVDFDEMEVTEDRPTPHWRTPPMYEPVDGGAFDVRLAETHYGITLPTPKE